MYGLSLIHISKIKEEVGPVDILVNNAGLMKRVPMIEMSHTDFLRVIDEMCIRDRLGGLV